jgi:hypothetical protein
MTTTTDSTLATLHHAILLNPGDDLPRLVYADRLEELAGSVPCDACRGHGSETSPAGDSERCITCNGTGYVSNGYADCAEFIRLQVEIARIDAPTLSEIKSGAYPDRKELRLRERSLWVSIPVDAWLLKLLDGITYSRTVFESVGGSSAYVHRGFVSSIRLTPEQFEQHAAELFSTHPITEVVLRDKEPYFNDGYDDDEASEGYTWFHYRNDDEDSIPPEIFRELDGYTSGGINCRNYPTREAALAALSRACVRYGRRLAGLPEEY